MMPGGSSGSSLRRWASAAAVVAAESKAETPVSAKVTVKTVVMVDVGLLLSFGDDVGDSLLEALLDVGGLAAAV